MSETTQGQTGGEARFKCACGWIGTADQMGSQIIRDDGIHGICPNCGANEDEMAEFEGCPHGMSPQYAAWCRLCIRNGTGVHAGRRARGRRMWAVIYDTPGNYARIGELYPSLDHANAAAEDDPFKPVVREVRIVGKRGRK